MSQCRLAQESGSKSSKSMHLSDSSTWSCLGLPSSPEPVPIKDAVGRIAILLNLEDDIARTNRVESSARDKNETVLAGSESDEEDQRHCRSPEPIRNPFCSSRFSGRRRCRRLLRRRRNTITPSLVRRGDRPFDAPAGEPERKGHQRHPGSSPGSENAGTSYPSPNISWR